MRRLLFTTVVIGTLVAAMTGAAFAAGAVWHFEGYHRPGDIVVSTTSVAWSHNGNLGTPEDGPYLIYLAPMDAGDETWLSIPDDALLVGIVEVHVGPYAAEDGQSYGPHHAVARFEIPDVAPGIYQIMHCNDPCTTTLGDIIGGWDLRVSSGSNGRPADRIAAEVRGRLATAPLVMPEEASTMAAAEQKPGTIPGTENDPVTQPTPATQETFRLDTLWQAMVGFVALLLVLRMVRTPR